MLHQTIVKKTVERKNLKRSKYQAKLKEFNKNAPKAETKAIAKYVRISPRKARSVINTIKGRKVSDAYAILELLPQKAARVTYKVLKSAVSNAVNNYKMAEDNLYVSEAWVNDGPRMKRIWPRGRGRADIIQKRMSHITVVVRDEEIEKQFEEYMKKEIEK